MKHVLLTSIWLAMLGFWFVLSTTLPPATAQPVDDIGLSIVPAIVDLPLNPPEPSDFSITITNITASPLPVKIGFRALAPIDPLVDESLRQRFDASSWLKADNSEIILEPQQSQSIGFSAQPPADAGPGGHYALIVFRLLSPTAGATGTSAVVNPEITSLVLFNVPGEVVESASVTLHNPPFWSFNPEREFEYSIRNTGNTHLLVTPKLELVPATDKLNETMGVDAPKLILPGTESTFQSRLLLGVGRYQVNANVSFGTPVQGLFSPIAEFIVLPAWWIIFGVATALWLLAVAGWRLVDSRRSHRRRQRQIKTTARQSLGRRLNPNELDEVSRDQAAKDISKKS